jgi:hypothetical protein
VKVVGIERLLKVHTPVPEGSWHLQGLQRAVGARSVHRQPASPAATPIGYRLRPVSGLSSWSCDSGRIAFPHPRGTQWLV